MNNYLNTKKWDLWVAAGGILIGRDIDLRVKIPIDIGTGVQMKRDDKIWTSTREFGGRDKNYLKTIKLKISSWRVLSIDAVHFYGVLTSPGVEFEISKDDNQRVSSSGLNISKQ
ncbi:hypothetical protein M0P65_06725 [Candidatus Gracilibacteria bacterium]|jgi:hypothetical protein|nr:hypothetical protein [Candidatus Gracilibacteria bacterium]